VKIADRKEKDRSGKKKYSKKYRKEEDYKG
jgi:hypothetical protein